MGIRNIFISSSLALLVGCGSASRIEIEADSFARGNVTVDRGDFGYGKGIDVILTPVPDAYVEYDVEIPSTAAYQIELRYASTVPRPLRLLVDGKVVNEEAANEVTGGFDPEHQMWIRAGDATLDLGRHTLRLESVGVFPHIDKLRLTSTTIKIGS